MKQIKKLIRIAAKRVHYFLLWLIQLPTVLAPYKRILLASYGKQMDEHIIDFCETVLPVENTRVYLYVTKYQSGHLKEYAKAHYIRCFEGKRIYSALVRHYDLVIGPDYVIDRYPQIVPPKKLYINHGLHIVGRNNGRNTYTYSDLAMSCKFDVMLEPNKHIAEAVVHSHPELANVVKWVGWKYAEREAVECSRTEFYKKQLQLSETKPTVFVLSTWGENSLFFKLGDKLFSELQRLSDRYTFLLSAHPIIYAEQPELRQKIDAQVQHGMKVRQPGEDWLPYVAASDIVLTDYSTLSEVAVCAGKKVIFTDFPEGTVWQESRLFRAKAAYPSLVSADQLEAVLEAVQTTPVNPLWKSFRDETYITRKEYEEKVRAIVRQLLNA